MYSKKMWNNIKKALSLFGLNEPTCLFVGSEGCTQYLFFAEIGGELIEAHSEELDDLNIQWVGKFECLGVNTEILWDNKAFSGYDKLLP